jgi:hypothetical protein
MDPGLRIDRFEDCIGSPKGNGEYGDARNIAEPVEDLCDPLLAFAEGDEILFSSALRILGIYGVL